MKIFDEEPTINNLHYLDVLFHLFLKYFKDPATFSLVSKVPQVKKSFIPY